MSEHIWAPELHYLDGKWYIYFAGGDKDDVWAIRPYVLECADADPLIGTWTEKGKMGRADEDDFLLKLFLWMRQYLKTKENIIMYGLRR